MGSENESNPEIWSKIKIADRSLHNNLFIFKILIMNKLIS